MPSYYPPLDDIRFNLFEAAGLESTLAAAHPGEDLRDSVDLVLRQAADFAAGVYGPAYAVGDREGARLEAGRVRVPDAFADAYRRYVEAGWSTLQYPAALGGQGLPVAVAVAVAEMFNGANLALSMSMMASVGAVALIERFGSERQKRALLPAIVAGRWTVTMAMTEPQAGSDLGAIRTRAERDGDHYRVFGQKVFITFGDHEMTDNIVHLLLARGPAAPEGAKGLSLYVLTKYLVDDDGRRGARNDIACIALEHKMGIRGSPSATLVFGAEGGARAELLGEENQGLAQMFILMNRARLNVGVFSLGSAERARQAALAYAGERVQGRDAAGRPATIDHHPDVRRMLTAMAARTEGARAIAYYTAGLIDRVANDGSKEVARLELLTPITKAWCTEAAFEATSLGVQVFGGLGYTEQCEASQCFRDSRVHMIYEGTTAVQANDLVFRKLRRDGGRAAEALFADVARSLDVAHAAANPRIAATAASLSVSLAALRQVTAAILAGAEADTARLQGGAVAYLMLFGAVHGGWLMLRGALAAAEDPVRWGAALATRKARLALFFATQISAPAAVLALQRSDADMLSGFEAA